MTVHVTGSGQTAFGELWHESAESLARQAGQEAMEEAQVKPQQIEAVFVGNMLLPMLEQRAHVGRIVADALDLDCPAFRSEAACASGGMAVHLAILSLLAGHFTTVLVVGVEKMSDVGADIIGRGLMGAGSEQEQLQGATFPALYGLMTRLYQQTYEVSDEMMAAQAVLTHDHAYLNPLAQFHQKITITDVLKSSMVADPIRLLNASPVSDGAAALVLSTRAQSKKDRVVVAGMGEGGDCLDYAKRKAFTSFSATKVATAHALRQAHTMIQEIQAIEVHDCFSVAQVVALEDLGVCSPGTGADWIATGHGRVGGNGLVVNSSGGLKGCGHPVGATGVKQIVELYRQLKGVCGKRQVDSISQGLAHNIGGIGATAAVTILRRQS